MTQERSLADLDWSKGAGLLPVVVQHASDGRVLMLGYMNQAALATTLSTRRVTFFSRSKQRLWMKGETSGHVLEVQRVASDCDHDTLLVLALPKGPTCHTGAPTCFRDNPAPAVAPLAFLTELETVIAARASETSTSSYTASLFAAGTKRMAQKVGEEGLEVALAAVAEGDAALLGESADLLFHLMVLLKSRKLGLAEVVQELERRHESKTATPTR